MKTRIKTRTKIRLLLTLCAAPLAWTGGASAQQAGIAPGAGADALPPQRIVSMVRANGFDPVGPPVRSGRVFAVRALDAYDLEVDLVVDARTGRLLSANEAAPRFGARRGLIQPYQPYEARVYGRIFGPAEAGFGAPRPPRSVPGVKSPADKAAAPAPLPRPRPYVVEATGSVPAAADTPVAQANPAPAPETSQKPNGGASMPPIAPLD